MFADSSIDIERIERLLGNNDKRDQVAGRRHRIVMSSISRDSFLDFSNRVTEIARSCRAEEIVAHTPFLAAVIPE